MYLTLVMAELATTLRQVITEKFKTSPRTSLAVAATTGLLTLVLLWSALSALVWPPRRNVYGSVAGTVTSVNGSPVGNALVLFVDDTAGAGSSARTDSGGYYSANGVPRGTFAVAIQPVIEVVNGELTKEAADAARTQLEASVPLRFQAAETSGLTVTLRGGRNRYDIDLSGKR